MASEHHHHFVVLPNGRPSCTLCGLDAPTEGPLSQPQECGAMMIGGGGFCFCRLAPGHPGHHLESSWELIR